MLQCCTQSRVVQDTQPQSLQAAAALAAESEANKNVTGLIKFSGKAANSGRELQPAAGTELVSLSQFSAWEVS